MLHRTLHRTLHWNAAALSLVVPGWGQFEQRRARAGRLFLAWAILSCGVTLMAPLLGVSTVMAGLELGLVTLWSAADALLADARE